ncbi:MAG: macro domain-containing protein [Clostridia bacterium]|nr:macro domain-containing protein [Clostridia bacterium]
MPLEIVRQDITKMAVDAIVNAANTTLLGGGGVDGAIHKAAGKELLKECKTLNGCKVGEAKITGAYNLPCKYVIHTVGPVYKDGCSNEKQMLTECYKNSLQIAKTRGIETIAFPLISSGAYGYPKDEALKVAVDSITDFLLENDMYVYIVVFDKSSFKISSELFSDIQEYIDDNYVDDDILNRGMTGELEAISFYALSEAYSRRLLEEETEKNISEAEGEVLLSESELSKMPPPPLAASMSVKFDLDEIVGNLDESFSEMLLRKIDENGMTDSECYKKANIDRKHFSKIRSNKNYKPKKQTALAFAIALELSLDETEDMLKKAGFALSKSSKFDVILEFFISNGIYDIHEINEALFAFDQTLLGA